MPGVFTIPPQTRNGQAAALNQDGTLNSGTNPAQPGSIVSVYMTGAGLMTTALTDGQLGPLQPPYPTPVLGISAVVGPGCYPFAPVPTSCVAASLLFVGQAPGLIAGLVQVNLQVPAGAPSGPNSLVIYVGAYATYPVSIAVQ
jgi:uncharacterized protein (TIGR03437 family)